MSNGAGAYGAAAAGHIMEEALKAIGSIIVVEPKDFVRIVEKNTDAIVVHTSGGMLSKNKYITSYKGLIFFTKTKEELELPANIELMRAKKMMLPQL
jgi:hypothetical protein